MYYSLYVKILGYSPPTRSFLTRYGHCSVLCVDDHQHIQRRYLLDAIRYSRPGSIKYEIQLWP